MQYAIDASEGVAQLVGEILRAEPVPPFDPEDLVPITVAADAPRSKVHEAMVREDARLRRVREHPKQRPRTATFGTVANATAQLAEIDDTLPDSMARAAGITAGDIEKTVTACVELYTENRARWNADLQLWIEKGRPPMTPGWRER